MVRSARNAACLLALLVGFTPTVFAQDDAPEEPAADDAPAPDADASEEDAAADDGADDEEEFDPFAEDEPEEAAEEPEADAEASASAGAGIEVEAGAEAEDDAPPPADEEEIVITGSRIKRNSFDAPTPVRVVNRDEILKTGASNMASLIRVLTANTGSDTQAGLGQGATGTANFNLRGLGIANTLVLVNGRRLVAYPAAGTNGSNFSDVNQVPLEFVERIEIAKGGASAVYGSDAIAGVVNIILRKNFDGLEASITGYSTDDFNQQDGQASFILGAESEDSSVVAQFSYFSRNPLRANERDFTAGSMISTVGSPGTYIPIGLVNGVPQAVGAQVDPGCGAPGSDSFVLDPGTPDVLTDDRCAFDFRNDWDLYNKDKRILGYVTAEHRVEDAFQVFGELGFFRREVVAPQSPSYPLLRNVTVPLSHPDVPALNPTPIPPVTLVYVGRPFGRAYGSGLAVTDTEGFRALGGFKGELDEIGMRDWSYDVSLTWHRNELLARTEDVLTDRFQDAVNSCSDPTDLSGCFNPFYSAIDGTGTQNSQEVVDSLFSTVVTKTISDIMVGDISLGGPLFELPGGDFSVAVGGQVRRLRQLVQRDNDSVEGNFAFLLGGPEWNATQTIVAGFAEIGMPFVDGLEVQAAVRAEHYINADTTVNPRVALSFKPSGFFEMPEVLEKFRLRGSIGTAFRGPNLQQTNGFATTLQQFQDPGPIFRGVNSSPNNNLEPETSVAFNAGVEWLYESFFLDIDYWQYNLSNLIVAESAQAVFESCRQQADSMSLPISQVPGCGERFTAPDTAPDSWQTLDISYVNRDSITTNGIDAAIRYSFDLGSGGNLALGLGGSYVLSYIVPREVVPELPVTQVDGTGAEVDGSVAQDGCSGDECDVSGKRNVNNFVRPIPKLRARPSIAWMLEGHTLNLAMNYISSYDDDGNHNEATGELNTIAAWATLDLNYRYKLGEWAAGSSTEFAVGVNNLLGTPPPFVANTNFSYDIFVHNPLQRVLFANVIHKF